MVGGGIGVKKTILRKITLTCGYTAAAGFCAFTAAVTGDNIIYWGAGLMIVLAVISWAD